MPKISVCIPVYNVEQYIGRCMESVLSQSLKDIEVIVVNDCTPDNSMEIVRRYAERDCRVKVHNHKENHGLMVARSTAYMAANGDYITFLDSDDTLAEKALENLYNAAVGTQADIVSGVIEYIPTKGAHYLWKNKLLYGSDKIAVFKSLLKDEFGHNLCSRLFRRELLQDYQYETFEKATNGEDAVLFYQVVDNSSSVIAIDNIVYEYRQNICSSSQVRLSDNALRSIAQANHIIVKVVGKYDELHRNLDRKVAKSYWRFKYKNYDIGKYFEEVGLGKYCKRSNLLLNQNPIDALKVLIKFCINKVTLN